MIPSILKINLYINTITLFKDDETQLKYILNEC